MCVIFNALRDVPLVAGLFEDDSIGDWEVKSTQQGHDTCT